jgi:hypothetical protein
MTAKRINEQIDTIREATKRASASPETALEFLRRAGIVATSTQPTKRSPKKHVVFETTSSTKVAYPGSKRRNITAKKSSTSARITATKTGKGKGK